MLCAYVCFLVCICVLSLMEVYIVSIINKQMNKFSEFCQRLCQLSLFVCVFVYKCGKIANVARYGTKNHCKYCVTTVTVVTLLH